MADLSGLSPHATDELIVDIQHREAVALMLRTVGVGHTVGPDDVDHALGLLRMSALHRIDFGTPDHDEPGAPPVDADELHDIVRHRCAMERDGWRPTMSVNRLVDSIIGDGTVGAASHKPMAAGALSAVPPPSTPLIPSDSQVGAGVRVGVVDTRPHADDAILIPSYRAGHAMFVKSLIKQHAPAAEIVPEPVLDASTGQASSWEVARAIVRLGQTEPAIDILNLSLGCYTLAGGPPLVIARAIERVASRGILVVAAAGNHGAVKGLIRGRTSRSACWPAAIPPVVAVGAVDRGGQRPDWSPDLPWVTCHALGVDVIGEYLTAAVVGADGEIMPFEGFAQWSGTSFAAAILTGLVAANMHPGVASAGDTFDSMKAAQGSDPTFLPAG